MKRALVLLTILIGPTLWAAEAPVELYNRAGDHYAAGRYTEAMADYESLLRFDIPNRDIYYNTANAYFKNGRLGKAILYWERAQRVAPRDPDIRANLVIARGLALGAPEAAPPGLLERTLDRITPDEAAMGAAVFNMAAVLSLWGIVLWGKRRPRVGGLLWNVFGLAVALAILATPLAILHHIARQHHAWAIVTETGESGARLITRAGPGQSEKQVTDLPEGARVEITRTQGGWVELAVGGGVLGWAPALNVERI